MPTQLHRKDHPRPKAKTVLVIEDDRVTLMVLEQIIKGAGYRVVTAADAAEALKAVRLERPGLVVADIYHFSKSDYHRPCPGGGRDRLERIREGKRGRSTTRESKVAFGSTLRATS